MRRILRSSTTTRMLANRFLPHRNIDRKSSPVPQFAARENSAVVRLDDFLGDIESQARRADVRGFIGKLRERLEDARQDRRSDARAAVAHDGARDIALPPD